MTREITKVEYQTIYENGLRKFNETTMQYKQEYSNFLVRCIVDSFLDFLQTANLEVRNGEINEKEK
jgi:hypothetical protein